MGRGRWLRCRETGAYPRDPYPATFTIFNTREEALLEQKLLYRPNDQNNRLPS